MFSSGFQITACDIGERGESLYCQGKRLVTVLGWEKRLG